MEIVTEVAFRTMIAQGDAQAQLKFCTPCSKIFSCVHTCQRHKRSHHPAEVMLDMQDQVILSVHFLRNSLTSRITARIEQPRKMRPRHTEPRETSPFDMATP